MITLYGFGPGFGLPEISPFVTKTEIQLKMAGLAYVKEKAKPTASPKGQLPYIQDGAEAIADSKVVVVKRSALNALAERDPAIGHDLFAITGRELRRVQDHLILLVKTARERVVSFLLEMAERAGGEKVVALPMPRQDIADYLGLTIETVSRTLTSLEGSAAIDILTSRRIALLNRTALNRLNG